MTTLLIATAVVAYIAADLYVARLVYGKMRARAIEKGLKEHPSLYTADPGAAFKRFDYGTTFEACVVAVFWPVALVCWGIARIVTHNPPASVAELHREREQQARRIRELEAELGIKGRP